MLKQHSVTLGLALLLTVSTIGCSSTKEAAIPVAAPAEANQPPALTNEAATPSAAPTTVASDDPATIPVPVQTTVAT